MAGAASGEEENYWPGYVDALTTMLMVLTFVMMVLGIVVFTLSQNVSKNVVAGVAQAMNIDTSALDARTPEALRQAVIEALKEKLAHPTQPPPTPGATALARAAEQPAPVPEPARTPIAPALPTFASGAPTLPSSPAPGPTPADAVTPGGPQIASLPLRDEAALQGAGRDKVIQNEALPTEAPREKPASLTEAGDGLKIVFKNGAVQLDQIGSNALQNYARLFEAGSFVVRASAFVANTGATDARRRAYYRAMLVRERIIQIGLPANRIVVEVRDDATSDAQDLVLVIGRNGSVK
ncbi:hypothetical protein GCM10007036_07530 [Alsobacter metallidurans]|uniref:OmpA-like domain-containing protein n=1 Tax=Alsobacter metallidurans TaxID=340221 RepID=A0A917MFT0_9HYPH|nr:hypothetical protein [Alsobacter metallidurans]GGH10783.1 hypothetical protein GCM10007036_07530 [Alsobacter metallidurans]